MGHPRRVVVVAAALVASLATVGVVQAQRFFREGSFAPRWAPAQMPDSSFVVCRLAYRSVRMEPSGIGWQTDYPYAEINLTTRLSELTKTRVSRDANQEPNFYVVRLTDDALFNCPIISTGSNPSARQPSASHNMPARSHPLASRGRSASWCRCWPRNATP